MFVYPPNNFLMHEPTFIKFGMSITATKPISTAYVVDPFAASQFTEAKP
jgi:hypothetical protein